MLGDKDSFVHGSISDGVFHGKIITSKDSYFVEKAHHYFPNHTADASFHSVIYKDDHVNDPYMSQREVHPNGCGLTDDMSHWMDRVQNGGGDEEIDFVPLKVASKLNDTQKLDQNENHLHHAAAVNRINDDAYPYQKYSKEANIRTKRAAPPRYQERNTCSLYIQTDPLIWRHIRESIPDVSFFFINPLLSNYFLIKTFSTTIQIVLQS